MSTAISGSQDVDLENVLQQVFLECDASLSTASMSEEVPIPRIVEYVRSQLPIWSIEHLLELQKCLVVVSANDRVNLRQFKEATKRWIAGVRRAQDGNNNLQERLCNNRNGATVDSMRMDMDRDITEIELRMRARKFDEENITLREELARLEELVADVERQRGNLEHQVDRYVEKCQQLEKENDEQKDKLNEAIQREKACASALQRSRKEHENLLRRLEAAEIEIQVIPFLRDKMDKINKEKTDYARQITKLKEQFYEREEEYGRLKITTAELEDTNSSIKENYESVIHNLREKNRQLADENTELQSWSVLNSASRERFSVSPIRNTDGCYMHSTPYRSEKMPLENSLYAELKASGFVAECGRNDPLRQELEEELDQYDAVISTLLEQIVQIFATMLNITDIAQFNPSDTENSRACNIEALKHKVASVLNMATEEIARRRNVKDSSTQLRADSATTESSDQLGISSFRNLLIRAQQRREKTGTDLRSTVTRCVSDNEDDPFLRVIRANVGVRDRNIIIPIVEELDRIIQNTINPSVNYKDHSTSGNSRCKSIHTLPSSLQLSSQTSSLDTEKSRQAGYQSAKTSSTDASFAQGDGPTRESYGEKFAESKVESCGIPDRENSLRARSTYVPRNDRSSETAEESSVPQMDPKMPPTLEETGAKSSQVSEVNGATAAASPRRKISVYYRSFDVVAVKDPREDEQGSTLEVRPPLDTSVRNEEGIESRTTEDRAYGRNDDGSKYLFDHSYRNAKNDSDSSNSCSPHVQSRDTLLDDESPTAQQISKRIRLAPVRLIFPQEAASSESNKSELLDITDARDDVFPDADSSGTDTYLSPIGHIDGCREGGDASVRSSPTFFVDKRETMDDTISQGHPTSALLISPKQPDPAKIGNSERPHSRTSVQRVGSDNQPRVERPVDSQMSSREYTSAVLDSECELAEPGDRCVDGAPIAMGANEANGTAADAVSLIGSASMETPCKKMVRSDGDAKQKRARRHLLVGRSFSEGESGGRTMYRCKQCGGLQTVPSSPVENQLRAFPSLTDARLQEFGIANSTDTEIDSKEDLTELELQKKYTAFSLCLCTDRITLSRRMEMSLRQRDQSEKNLSCEVRKMQRDIQELAPLCTDRESVEKVDRVRHQLDMIARCAHRVSCAAETLGAVHQENRVSKAILLADRYLQLLQSRCEKLAVNLAETKRILTENNIVVEENSSELSDDISRIRYRSGTPANNRMMMARRRASIATMSRPGSTQDVIKDTMRQRNSVSGRVTLRRPSLTYETPKRELEKLDRTNSSSSIGELRGISEHIESQRDSTEKNNNTLPSDQSDSQSVMRHSIVDNGTWTNAKQETCPEIFSVNESTSRDSRPSARTSHLFRLRSALTSWHMVMWTILIFFFGFYVNHAISTMSTCNSNGLLSQWSIEEILRRYVQTRRNASPHPI